MTHELWARFLLVIAALVVVPLACSVCPAMRERITASWARGLLLCAALLLAAAQFVAPGMIAASLAVPWFVATCGVALAGLHDAWRFRRGPLARLIAACGMTYLSVGGGWSLLDRGGIRPLGFDPAIVLLTAIHFHYAGFALPILTSLAECGFIDDARSSPRAGNWFWRGTSIAVLASVPLVAVGITASQAGFSPMVELVAAWCMSLAGLAVAWLYFRLGLLGSPRRQFTRELWAFGALFLACGMTLSILYGSRAILPLAWLDIPMMRALHGTANALGFTIPCLLGWVLEFSSPYRGVGSKPGAPKSSFDVKKNCVFRWPESRKRHR